MKNIEFDIIPQRSAVMAGHATQIHALVRARAPKQAEEAIAPRVPLNLALVIDRSGSMHGAPLEEAKRCAAFIVDRLESRDSVSIVVYDDRADVVVKHGQHLNKERVKRAISQIRPGGTTALFDGWERGAREALSCIEDSGVTRVLLLSDGCANQGLTDSKQISVIVGDMAKAGVSTSTYGLGHHFNEELMVEMAQAGAGQSYYGEAAEDLMDPFEEEFSLLSSLYARDLKLTLSVPAGVTVEMLNPYRQLGENSWRLPDLAFDAEAWALVKLTVLSELPQERGDIDLEIMRAFLGFSESGEQAHKTETASLYLPRIDPSAWASVAENERVVGRMQELQVALLQREARDAARREDWQAVDAIVDRAEQEAGNNAWVRESLRSIRRYARLRDRERVSKEAMYSARRMESRLAGKYEIARDYTAEAQFELPDFLRRKPEQGKRLRK